MIQQSVIEEVLAATKIEDVVGDKIQLRKSGANLKARCPFHHEKTASFTVSPAKNIFKCFGCGISGNAASFLIEYDSITFPEAIRRLGKEYGIDVKQIKTPEEETLYLQQEAIYLLNERTANFFHAQRKYCLEYLTSRGYTFDTINKFQLGFSKASLVEKASKSNTPITELEAASLAREGRDFFYNRLMIPIRNLSGKIAGFAGRILDDNDKAPKYINTANTSVYDKSKLLFGLYFAKQAIRRKNECFIVEGYTDVIALYNKAGFENVVATCGTALTQDHIKLISRFTKNIVLVRDGDTAGQKATMRDLELLLSAGMQVEIVPLSEGVDPDSFAKKSSKKEVEWLLNERRDFIEYLLLKNKEKLKDNPAKRSQVHQEFIRLIQLIPNEVSRAMYVERCTEALQRNFLQKHLRIKKSIASLKLEKNWQERDLVRIILAIGEEIFDEENNITYAQKTVDCVFVEQFNCSACKYVMDDYHRKYKLGQRLSENNFPHHRAKEVRTLWDESQQLDKEKAEKDFFEVLRILQMHQLGHEENMSLRGIANGRDLLTKLKVHQLLMANRLELIGLNEAS